MRRKWMAGVAAVVLGLWGSVAAAETPAVQLEAAKFQENTAGNMDKAITAYTQIVDEADANRKYVAEALYRLGMCYQKKGDKDKAVSAFGKVVALYPEQTEIVTLAKKELPKPTAPADTVPDIVATTPATYSTDVDPSLPEMKVTFDMEMKDGSWSWTGGGDTFPKGTGPIKYDAARKTCSRPVKLEPGKVYWVGVNSPSHKNFRAANGTAADWYIVLFATKSADGNPTPIPEDLLNKAKQINAGAGPEARAEKRAEEARALAEEATGLWQERKLREAEAKFKESLDKDPTQSNAWNGLGWTQFNQGKPTMAKASFLKCIEIAPDHAAALNGLGWIAKNEKKPEAAIGYWEKAVAAQPAATAALAGLTATYMEMEKPDKAITYYEMWLNVEPGNADAQAGLAKAKAVIQHK